MFLGRNRSDVTLFNGDGFLVVFETLRLRTNSDAERVSVADKQPMPRGNECDAFAILNLPDDDRAVGLRSVHQTGFIVRRSGQESRGIARDPGGLLFPIG